MVADAKISNRGHKRFLFSEIMHHFLIYMLRFKVTGDVDGQRDMSPQWNRDRRNRRMDDVCGQRSPSFKRIRNPK
jgi:hypothetical protein